MKVMANKSELTSTFEAYQSEDARRVDDPSPMPSGVGLLFEELRTGILAA